MQNAASLQGTHNHIISVFSFEGFWGINTAEKGGRPGLPPFLQLAVRLPLYHPQCPSATLPVGKA